MVYYGPHDGSSCESEVISMSGAYIYIYTCNTPSKRWKWLMEVFGMAEKTITASQSIYRAE